MDFAVIRTGGKQYIAEPHKKIRIEKIAGKEGEEVSFEDVLLVAKKGSVSVGMPNVKDAKVMAKILKQGRAKKVVVFKYKPKKRYRVKRGHRQHYTEVEIEKIL